MIWSRVCFVSKPHYGCLKQSMCKSFILVLMTRCSVNIWEAKHLEDIFWEKLTKGSATPPDPQVERLVARIQSLTISHSCSNAHFTTTCNMRKPKKGQKNTTTHYESRVCVAHTRTIPEQNFFGQKYAPGHCGSGVVPAQIQSGGKVLLLLWGSSQRAEFGTWDLIIIFDLCSGPPLVQSDLQSMWQLSKRYFWNMRILWGISNVGLLLDASHWQMNIPEDNLSILQGLCPKSKPAIASAERGYHGKVFW